jgi:LacI family transcriptional regulator, galactose operon repressor
MTNDRPITTTIADVAREAGVSVSTAARVLRGSSYPVAEALSKRVHDAALRLGYVPNLLARNLRSAGRGTGALGLIVGDMREPYYGEIAAVVTAEAFAASSLAVVANMHRDPVLEIGQCRKLWEHRINGLILAGGGFDQMTYAGELKALIASLQRSGVVVVSLSERNLDLPRFSADNEAVGRLLAEEALRLGHARIGIAAGPAGSYVTQARLRGIRSVLAPAGIAPRLVHTVFSREGALRAAEELMTVSPDLTMILATSDTLAIGTSAWLQAKGLRVPNDISVLGSGNTSHCQIASPAMSSVDIALEACCRAAVRYIVARWAGETPEVPAFFPSRVMTRSSTAPAKIAPRAKAQKAIVRS